MKQLFLMIVLMLSVVSCKAQDLKVDQLSRGHAIGLVVELTETGAVVNAGGRSLVVNGELEKGIEYDLVYEIIEKRPNGVLVVNLIGAEPSAKQNATDRAKLLELLKL